MDKVHVDVKNIGGIDNLKTKLQIGSVNIVKGSSSSGKSSLMRGIHLGIVGRPLMEDVYADEAKILHLDDRTTDQALLRRGAAEGSATINAPSGTMSATIPRSGVIKGTNSVSKGLFTTMLSRLPPTRLYQAVNDAAGADDPDDFRWVVEDLSEAGKFQTWHNVLNSLDQEVKTIRTKFSSWKSSLAGADTRHEEISLDLESISERRKMRAKKKGKVEGDIAEDLGTAQRSATNHEKEFRRLDGEFRQAESTNALQSRRKDSAQIQLKNSKKVLDEAEDLLDTEFIEPNTTKLDADIAAAEEKVDKANGDSSPSVRSAVDSYLAKRSGIVSDYPKHAKSMEVLVSESGDSEALQIALAEYNQATSARDIVVKNYLEKKRKFGMAEQQAAAARAEIQSARSTIKEAEQSMTLDSGTLTKMKENRDTSERDWRAMTKEVADLQAKLSSDDPEDIADQTTQRELQDELANLESSTSFEIRFTSLNMLANQTMILSQEDAEAILGTGDGGTAKQSLIKTHLAKGESEIRSLLIVEIDRGFLADLTATSTWAAEEADRQRQETRRVFNDVGTTLFNRLKVSPIIGVSLNTEYQLEISWSDGKTTGLTGAGGERTIIAAAMLIAMRKAYTPGVPILMFDDVLDALDPGHREELLLFLGEYAKTEGVAIVASVLDRKVSVATVMTL